ncbi:MAG TPA: hypothetical protein VFP87_12055 [Chitinophagaceae bacterium]|nr:hypothetical protein [Chitinophagaceae bacterium]
MKSHLFFVLFIAAFFLLSNTKKNIDRMPTCAVEPGRWTGTVTMEQTTIFPGPDMIGRSDKKIVCTFLDALPTMYRDLDESAYQPSDNKGKGSYSLHSEVTLGGQKGVTDCNGTGEAELHAVTINESDHTYDIEVIGPGCSGTTTGTGGTQAYGPDTDDDITITYGLPGPDINSLAGGTTATAKDPSGLSTTTTTISWHLTRSQPQDVELIVTPEGYDKDGHKKKYDDWLPEPGRTELNKGSIMTINLELQSKNKKPLKARVESFELRLNNTSREPGITINYPIEPASKPLPDLRFLMVPNIESVDEDQFISIGSPDGITGKAYIASYDGGGWTTLTVDAILKDEHHTHIQGKLLVSNGEVDIRIPKRDPNVHIAEAWLKANGNPGEMDDKEQSNGNGHDGDGLTAYEEYRGVISEGKYRRLYPDKKELGVRLERAERSFFLDGLEWFKKASDIDIVRFTENEIGDDRLLNKNSTTAHIYPQCAILLEKGGLKNALGKTFPEPGIPKDIEMVIIDEQACLMEYRFWQAYAKKLNEPVPFSSNEFIANAIAHELGHTVACIHHGPHEKTVDGPAAQKKLDDAGVKYSIISYDGSVINLPYRILGKVGTNGNEESGDISCLMAYQPFCWWALNIKNGVPTFTGLRLYPLGNIMCNSTDGKYINEKDAKGDNDYFGDVSSGGGNCKPSIKLK